MFGSNGSRKDALKRAAKSFLETSGLVCGSLKDTLADKDVEWLENEIGNIKTKMEKPREQIYNHAEQLCRGGQPLSPITPDSAEGSHYFEDDDTIGSRTASTGEFSSRFKDLKKRKEEKKNRAQSVDALDLAVDSTGGGEHSVVIGLCLSRRHPTLGHPDTVTRQTAFDFNELQDRNYKYVSSTDESGWLAGGGEKGISDGERESSGVPSDIMASKSDDSDGPHPNNFGSRNKIAATDKVHIPIIRIDANSAAAVDEIISALAQGEIFIPHVSILPESLSVNGLSPPDLVVRFGCEKNDDANPEDWPNWCLEFLHNQLYDYFAPMGARWTKRPFQITLARKVKWKTVKSMNKFFAHSEHVINSWREKGPQYLQPPETSYGATQEEITRPHGIYLIRNGVPTNYFAPNFEPPYTTKMTRSLLRNVINKSWDVKRRDWILEPVPKMRTPAQLISSVMGCAIPGTNSTLSPVNQRSDAIHVKPGFIATQKPIGPTNKSLNHGEKKEHAERKESHAEETHQKRPTNTEQKPDLIPSESYDNASPTDSSLGETLTDQVTAPDTTYSSESQDKANNWSGNSIAQDSSSKTEEDLVRQDPHQINFSIGTSSGTSIHDQNNDCYEKQHPEHQLKSTFSNSVNGQHGTDTTQHHDHIDKVAGTNHDQSLLSANERLDNSIDRSLNGPHSKIMDTRAEKYAKTKSKRREMRDRRQDDNVDRGLYSKISPRKKRSDLSTGSSNNIPSPSCESTNMSLAYSLDSASALRVVNTTDGGSVMTMGTENQSLLSYVTRSTLAHSRFGHEPDNADADDISLSLLESKSAPIPTDEELMAIGWGKALDPNSGSYYYFTLDRSKTVWENPLE